MSTIQEASEPMSQWVIYLNPRDYVEHYELRGLPTEEIWVARQWFIGTGDRAGQMWASPVTPYVDQFLENVRRFVQTVQPGAVCLTRSPEDDPTIVETWI